MHLSLAFVLVHQIHMEHLLYARYSGARVDKEQIELASLVA